jgi:hypothetical protein
MKGKTMAGFGAILWFFSLICAFVIPPIGIPFFIIMSLVWGFGVSTEGGPMAFIASLLGALIAWATLAGLIWLFLWAIGAGEKKTGDQDIYYMEFPIHFLTYLKALIWTTILA